MENYVAPTRQSCAGHATVSQSRHSLCVIAVIVTLSSESVYSHICLQCHGQRAMNTCIHSRLDIKCSAHPVLPPQSPSLTRSEPIPLSLYSGTTLHFEPPLDPYYPGTDNIRREGPHRAQANGIFMLDLHTQ